MSGVVIMRGFTHTYTQYIYTYIRQTHSTDKQTHIHTYIIQYRHTYIYTVQTNIHTGQTDRHTNRQTYLKYVLIRCQLKLLPSSDSEDHIRQTRHLTTGDDVLEGGRERRG